MLLRHMANLLIFFNREEELELALIMDSLDEPPELTLITRLVNSGKSWLMEHITD